MNQTPVDIAAIYLSGGHDFKGRHGKRRAHNPIEEVEQVRCIAGKGLKGDRFFDYRKDYPGQITFFDLEIFEMLRSFFRLSDLDPSALRRNVIIKGIDLNSLIGFRFELQGITFEGTQECAPCYWMNEAIARGAEDFLKGRGGLRARIIKSGTLSKGPGEISFV